MYTTATELVFPPRVIPKLQDERDFLWRNLIIDSHRWSTNSVEKIALVLMLARLNNCLSCNADSYRAIHGCDVCTKQSLKRFHGTDEDLVHLYENAKDDVTRHNLASTNTKPSSSES